MKEFNKVMYVIIDLNGNVIPTSINYSKKYCIKNFLADSGITWIKAKKIGWQCKKVDVNIRDWSNFGGWEKF